MRIFNPVMRQLPLWNFGICAGAMIPLVPDISMKKTMVSEEEGWGLHGRRDTECFLAS